MQERNWLAKLAKRRILWSVVQCFFWAVLAILSWRHNPSGILVWILFALFVFSLYMLRLEVVSHRMAHPSSEQK
jgi:asparagine N-glycosylation enzyme membrane subunit Stt3